MTKQTINELTNFFQQFKQGETKQSTQSNLTFDDAVKYFFRNMEERGLAEQTMNFYKKKPSQFRKFLVQIKKVQTLETLTEDEIKYYIESKYSKKKIGYYNCHARALRAFFNYLEKDGYLIANSGHNIKPKKVRQEKIDYFTIDQVRKMITSFDLRYKSELRNLLLVLVLIDTGVHNSELVRIKLKDINFQNRSIYVYATKTNIFRTVYYSKETERILNVYRREVLKETEKGPFFVKFHMQFNEPMVGHGINTEMVYSILRRRAKKIFW